jgi:hypothetical protein
MAMNPKLKEGSILLYYPDIKERHSWAGYRQPSALTGYELTVNALYVYNRRERTSGATVPLVFEPYLNMLKVRTNKYYNDKNVTAVGCRSKTLYRQVISADANIPNAFREAFKNVKELATFGETFFENEFVEKFLQTKLGNKDKKFVLFTPIERIQGFHPVKELKPLEDNEVWTESKRYKQPRQ